MATQGTIYLQLTERKGWMADFRQTDAAQAIADVFGEDTLLPLPFTGQADRSLVVAHVLICNPGCLVVILD